MSSFHGKLDTINEDLQYIANKLLEALALVVEKGFARRTLDRNQSVIAPSPKAESVALVMARFPDHLFNFIFYMIRYYDQCNI